MKHKFNIGNIIKYKGDIYKITGINNYGYDVSVVEYSDPEEIKTGIGFCMDSEIKLLSNYKDGVIKKVYPVFRIDICFIDYAIHYILVGAVSVEDLIDHIHEFLTDNDINFSCGRVDKLVSETSRFEEVKNMYTDKPYTIIDSYSYVE